MTVFSKNLYEATKRVIASKPQKYLTEAKVTAFSVTWPVGDKLVCVSLGKGIVLASVAHVNEQGEVVDLGVTDAELWIVWHAMDEFVETVNFLNGLTNMEKARRWIKKQTRKLHNMFAKRKIIEGHFLSEKDCSRVYSLAYYVKRGVELGNKKLGLVLSRVIEDRIFFAVGENEYFVFSYDSDTCGVDMWSANELSLSSCTPMEGIRVLSENVVISNLKQWVEEAGG